MKLVGVYGDMNKGQFITVSEWMAHGNVMEYIKTNQVNRLELVRALAVPPILPLKCGENSCTGPGVSPWCQRSPWRPQGSQCLFVLPGISLSNTQQANILLSNDTPPRACLADFGFMTIVLNPKQPLSCCGQLEGGTTTFMASELLVPGKYGFTEPVPTQKSDIYAFGLVIYQVRDQDRGYLSCAYTI